jgi:hypothetical protein
MPFSKRWQVALCAALVLAYTVIHKQPLYAGDPEIEVRRPRRQLEGSTGDDADDILSRLHELDDKQTEHLCPEELDMFTMVDGALSFKVVNCFLGIIVFQVPTSCEALICCGRRSGVEPTLLYFALLR